MLSSEMSKNGERLKRMYRATMAQLVSVGAAVAGVVMTGNPSYSVEIFHSGADSAIHASRYFGEKYDFDQNTKGFKRFLRAGLFASAGAAAWIGYKTGVDILNGFQEETSPSYKVHLIGAAVIAGANVYANSEMNKIEEHSHASEVGRFHTLVDKYTSLATAGFLALESAGIDYISYYGAVGCAAVTAGSLGYEAATLGKHDHHH